MQGQRGAEKPTPEEQKRRFIEAAREVGASDDEADVGAAMKRTAKPRPSEGEQSAVCLGALNVNHMSQGKEGCLRRIAHAHDDSAAFAAFAHGLTGEVYREVECVSAGSVQVRQLGAAIVPDLDAVMHVEKIARHSQALVTTRHAQPDRTQHAAMRRTVYPKRLAVEQFSILRYAFTDGASADLTMMDHDQIETAERLSREARETARGGSYRLRVLLDMVLNELERERRALMRTREYRSDSDDSADQQGN